MSRPTQMQIEQNMGSKVKYELIITQLQMLNQSLFNESFVVIKNNKTGQIWQSPKFYFKMFEVWKIIVDGTFLELQLFMKFKAAHNKISETELAQGTDTVYMKQLRNPKNQFCILRYQLKQYVQQTNLKKTNHFLHSTNIFDSFINDVSRVQPAPKKHRSNKTQDQLVGFNGDLSVISELELSRDHNSINKSTKKQQNDDDNQLGKLNKVNQNKNKLLDDEQKIVLADDSVSFIQQFIKNFPDIDNEKPPTTPNDQNQQKKPMQNLPKIKQNAEEESQDQYINTAQKWYTNKFNKKNSKGKKKNYIEAFSKKAEPSTDTNGKNIKINQFNTPELLQNQSVIKQISDISVQQNIKLKSLQFSLTSDGGESIKLYQVSRNDGNSSSLWYTALSLPNQGTILIQCQTEDGQLNGCLGKNQFKKGECIMYDSNGDSVCNFTFKCKSICNYIVQTQQLLHHQLTNQTLNSQNKQEIQNIQQEQISQYQKLDQQTKQNILTKQQAKQQNIQNKPHQIQVQNKKQQVDVKVNNNTFSENEIVPSNRKQAQVQKIEINKQKQKVNIQEKSNDNNNLCFNQHKQIKNGDSANNHSISFKINTNNNKNNQKSIIQRFETLATQDRNNQQQADKSKQTLQLQNQNKYQKQVEQKMVTSIIINSSPPISNTKTTQLKSENQKKINLYSENQNQYLSSKHHPIQSLTLQREKKIRDNQHNSSRYANFKLNGRQKTSNLSSRLKRFQQLGAQQDNKQSPYISFIKIQKQTNQNTKIQSPISKARHKQSIYGESISIDKYIFRGQNNAEQSSEHPPHQRERFSSFRSDRHEKQGSFRLQKKLQDDLKFQHLNESIISNIIIQKNKIDFKIQSIMVTLNHINYNSKIVQMQIQNNKYFTQTSKSLYVSKWEGKGYFFPGITKYAILHINLIQQNQTNRHVSGRCNFHLSLLTQDKYNQSSYFQDYLRDQNQEQIGKVVINYKIIKKKLRKISSKQSQNLGKIRSIDLHNLQSRASQLKMSRKKGNKISTEGSSRSIDSNSAMNNHHRKLIAILNNNSYGVSESVLSRYKKAPPLSKRKYKGGNILIPKASRFIQQKVSHLKKYEPGPGSYEVGSMFDRHASPL